jgi:hypothetical protein
VTGKNLLVMCLLGVVLLTPSAASGVGQGAGPSQTNLKARRIISSMGRAIAVYTSSGSFRGAMRHVQVAEEEVAALSYVLPADHPLMNALQLARNDLAFAVLISDAHLNRRRVTDEDVETFSVLCNGYGVPPGRGGRLQTGACVRQVMRDLRRRHRAAIAVATREGVYQP